MTATQHLILNPNVRRAVVLAASISVATLLGSCGDAAQNEIGSDPTPTEPFDVSAGLRNALSFAASHQVTATDQSGTTTVRLTISPKGEVTLTDGSVVNSTESVNQTTSPSGAVTESKTITHWVKDTANNDRIRIVSVATPAANVFLDVTSHTDLPGPVLVNTNGSYYDGPVTQNTTRLGSASVNWALQANDAQTAWACTVATTTYSAGIFSDCYLINMAGELQGRYKSIISEGSQGVIFQ